MVEYAITCYHLLSLLLSPAITFAITVYTVYTVYRLTKNASDTQILGILADSMAAIFGAGRYQFSDRQSLATRSKNPARGLEF